MAKKTSSAKAAPRKASGLRATVKRTATSTAKTVVKKAKAKADPPSRAAPKPVKIKCPLSRKELADFRAMLLEKRRTLLGDMDGMHAEAMRDNHAQGSSDLSTMPVHMADVGTDNYEQEFTLGLLESERQLLRDIDEALVRMANGTYGVCLGTGKPINKSRLRAMPWAKYSIEYARQLERGLVAQPRTGGSALFDEEELEEEHEEEEAEHHEVVEEPAYEPEDDDLGF